VHFSYKFRIKKYIFMEIIGIARGSISRLKMSRSRNNKSKTSNNSSLVVVVDEVDEDLSSAAKRLKLLTAMVMAKPKNKTPENRGPYNLRSLKGLQGEEQVKEEGLQRRSKSVVGDSLAEETLSQSGEVSMTSPKGRKASSRTVRVITRSRIKEAAESKGDVVGVEELYGSSERSLSKSMSCLPTTTTKESGEKKGLLNGSQPKIMTVELSTMTRSGQRYSEAPITPNSAMGKVSKVDGGVPTKVSSAKRRLFKDDGRDEEVEENTLVPRHTRSMVAMAKQTCSKTGKV
jgi:hypothetical protein